MLVEQFDAELKYSLSVSDSMLGKEYGIAR